MQVNTSCVALVVRASRQQYSQYADYDDLWDWLIIIHVSFVEKFDWMVCFQIESRGHLRTEEELLILLQVEEFLKPLDSFALAYFRFSWINPCLFHGRSNVFSKQKSHIDEEDYQEFSDWHYCEFERYFDGSHADLFDADELTFGEFVRHSWIIVVVD